MVKIISIISNGKRLDIPVKEFVEKHLDAETKKALSGESNETIKK